MAPPSNVLGSHLSEMAFVNVTPDVTDVFFPCSTIRKTDKLRAIDTAVVEGNAEK